jgi:hypothetical protein
LEASVDSSTILDTSSTRSWDCSAVWRTSCTVVLVSLTDAACWLTVAACWLVVARISLAAEEILAVASCMRVARLRSPAGHGIEVLAENAEVILAGDR